MYAVLNEGEEIATFSGLEDVKKFVKQLRDEFTADEEYDMERYPCSYDEGYKAGAGFDEYFKDVYSVSQDVPVEQFL